MLPDSIWLKLSIEEQRRLTDYATVARYPGDYEPIQLSEAKHSLTLARRVRKEIRSFLPKEVLSNKRHK